MAPPSAPVPAQRSVSNARRSVTIRKSAYDLIMENLKKNRRASIKAGAGRRIAVVLDKNGMPMTIDGRPLMRGHDLDHDSSVSEDSLVEGSQPSDVRLGKRPDKVPLKFEPRARRDSNPVGPVAGPDLPQPVEAQSPATKLAPALGHDAASTPHMSAKKGKMSHSPHQEHPKDAATRAARRPTAASSASPDSPAQPGEAQAAAAAAAATPMDLDTLQRALGDKVAQGLVSGEDAAMIIAREEAQLKKVAAGESSAADSDLEQASPDDADVIGSTVSGDEEDGGGPGGGGLAGPWLIRFPKAGDVCFVGLEASVAPRLSLEPVPVRVHFIPALKSSSSAAAAPVHASLEKLFGQPVLGLIRQEYRGETLFCSLEQAAPEQAAPGTRSEGISTAAGSLVMRMEWGAGVPVLSGKVGSQAFSSVQEEEVLARWSPKGEEGEGEEEGEGGEEEEEPAAAATAGEDSEEVGAEDMDLGEGGGGQVDGEEAGEDSDEVGDEDMDLDSLDEDVLSEIERDAELRKGGRFGGAVATGEQTGSEKSGMEDSGHKETGSEQSPRARVRPVGQAVHGELSQRGGRGRQEAGKDEGGRQGAREDGGGEDEGGRQAEGKGAAARSTDVLVRGLAPRTRRDDLHRLFAKCGSIRYIRLVLKKDAAGALSGKSGSGKVDFAIIEFVSEKSAALALLKAGSKVSGARIQVSLAKSALPMASGADDGGGNRKGRTSQVSVTQVPAGAGKEVLVQFLGGSEFVADLGTAQPMKTGNISLSTGPPLALYRVMCHNHSAARRLVTSRDKASLSWGGRDWRLRVHYHYGKSAGPRGLVQWSPVHKSQCLVLEGSGSVVQRRGASSAYVFSSEPLCDSWWCEIRVTAMDKGRDLVGGLQIGVSSHAEHPAGGSASSLPAADTWVLHDEAATDTDHAMTLLPSGRKYGYGSLSLGDEVRIIREGERVHFVLNGLPQGVAFSKLPGKLYLCAALKGRCTAIKIVGQGPL